MRIFLLWQMALLGGTLPAASKAMGTTRTAGPDGCDPAFLTKLDAVAGRVLQA